MEGRGYNASDGRWMMRTLVRAAVTKVAVEVASDAAPAERG
jgi:hypothetical protein